MKHISNKFRAAAACVALLTVSGLHAQTTTSTTTTTNDGMAAPATSTTTTSAYPASTTTTSPAYASNTNMSGTDWNASPHLSASVEAAYAFRLKTTGVIADIGGIVAPGQFLGFEYTHFRATGSSFDSRAGRINNRENINTYEFAYRFHAPLAQFAMNGQPSPVDFYAGVSGGIGEVDLHTTVPAFNFGSRSEDDGILSAAGVAGLEWNINRNWGIKAGYRYIYMHHVSLFGSRGNIDTSVAEAGLNFRW